MLPQEDAAVADAARLPACVCVCVCVARGVALSSFTTERISLSRSNNIS